MIAPKHKPLVLRDELHGDIQFDYLIQSVIDHEYFQRLRHIKQLGLADFVFPCATHTRFQHSLGAAYLASEYFESMIHNWLNAPLNVTGSCGQTEFYAQRTYDCVRSVHHHPSSRAYWKQVVTLAGLLHDVGHGPWSHTFEHLEIQQDFSQVIAGIGGPIGDYYRSEAGTERALMHEDISVFYIHEILKELCEQDRIPDFEMFFLPVATLVNRKLLRFHPEWQNRISEELSMLLSSYHIEGGEDFHRLLRPMVSGPFDVDRMDYIQRDGRNCGVSMGAIEWRRIVSKLVPCLAHHVPTLEEGPPKDEPRDVVFLTSAKNQHVLDDFIFSLFQMYTQVYLHPKVVGLEKVIHETIEAYPSFSSEFQVDFQAHLKLTDEKLRAILAGQFEIEAIEKFFLRKPGYTFDVSSHPSKEMEASLKEKGYQPIRGLDRPMMKDSIGVFLFTRIKDGDDESYFVKSWANESPIAKKFFTINYVPNIWLK